MKRFGILLAAAVFIASAAPAHADVTAFLGANTTPSNRVAKGLAAGMGLLVIGLEFEYPVDRRGRDRGRPVAQDRHGQRAAADTRGDLRLPAVLHDWRGDLPGNVGRGLRHRFRREHRAAA